MSNFAYVDNGVIAERYDTLPRSWRNISGLNLLLGNEAELNNLGWYTIQHIDVPFDDATQFIADYTYEWTGTGVTSTPVILDKPAGPDPVTEWRRSLRLTPYQAKVVLLQSGLLDTVNTMMASVAVVNGTWAAETSYTQGQNIVNGTYVYTCMTAGISGITGPTGLGTGISDGTCIWDYVEPYVNSFAKLAWTEAIEFKRLDDNIIGLGAALGLTAEQLDNMFVTGATIGLD